MTCAYHGMLCPGSQPSNQLPLLRLKTRQAVAVVMQVTLLAILCCVSSRSRFLSGCCMTLLLDKITIFNSNVTSLFCLQALDICYCYWSNPHRQIESGPKTSGHFSSGDATSMTQATGRVLLLIMGLVSWRPNQSIRMTIDPGKPRMRTNCGKYRPCPQ